jgi:hypothetical protein
VLHDTLPVPQSQCIALFRFAMTHSPTYLFNPFGIQMETIDKIGLGETGVV